MEARSHISLKQAPTEVANKSEDKFALNTMKFAQGLGASLRYAQEIHAVQQVHRLPCLKSSNLHEDVLRGNLGPASGFMTYHDDRE